MDAIQVTLLKAGRSGRWAGAADGKLRADFCRSMPTDQFSTNHVGRRSDRLEYVLRRRIERGQ